MKRVVGIVILLFFFITITGCTSSRSVVNNDTPGYLPNEKAKLVGFKTGTEPEGFSGIKWETMLSTLERMEHHRTDRSYGGIEFYLRKGDTFKLANGKALPIQYGFWRGKFYVGMATTKGLRDWNALKETIFNKFGEGTRPFSNKEEYLWVGKNAVMALQYNQITKQGLFYIKSDSIAKQMENYGAG